MATIEEARQALSQTTFDPTLRQLEAELFMKEQAAIVADRALQEAALRIVQQTQEIEQLKKDLDAAVTEGNRLRTELAARDVLAVVPSKATSRPSVVAETTKNGTTAERTS